MKRPCIVQGCGALTTSSRCQQHRLKQAPRPYRYRAQYAKSWPRVARAQVQREPWCAACGSDTDLVADHIVPGDLSAGLQTLCRACNSRRAVAMRRG